MNETLTWKITEIIRTIKVTYFPRGQPHGFQTQVQYRIAT